MNRPSNIIPLHRAAAQVPPIGPAAIGRALRDGRAHQHFSAPAVHERIGGCPRWLDVSAKAFIIAAGVVSVALWVAL